MKKSKEEIPVQQKTEKIVCTNVKSVSQLRELINADYVKAGLEPKYKSIKK